MKYSINKTFSAEKIISSPISGIQLPFNYVRIKSSKGATTGIMLQDKTINIITCNISVDDFKELSAFIEWVKENFWNI